MPPIARQQCNNHTKSYILDGFPEIAILSKSRCIWCIYNRCTPSGSYVVGTSVQLDFRWMYCKLVTLLIGVMRLALYVRLSAVVQTARLPEPSMAVQIMVLVPSVIWKGHYSIGDLYRYSICIDVVMHIRCLQMMHQKYFQQEPLSTWTAGISGIQILQ